MKLKVKLLGFMVCALFFATSTGCVRVEGECFLVLNDEPIIQVPDEFCEDGDTEPPDDDLPPGGGF
jgi:hypothetical protein